MTARPADNQRIQELYIQLNAIRKRIELLNLTAQDFSNDTDPDSLSAAYVDAVIVLFYRAIEEANELSYETKWEYPNIPWDQIRGMRNAVAHAYFKLDLPTVWDTIEHDLSALREVCEQYAENHGLKFDPHAVSSQLSLYDEVMNVEGTE